MGKSGEQRESTVSPGWGQLPQLNRLIKVGLVTKVKEVMVE